MAALTQAPTLAPAQPPAPALAPPSSTDDLKRKLAQGPEDTKAQLDRIETDREGSIARLEGERDQLKPPQLQSVPAPTAKSTDPMHVWGSAAITFALLGSLMTRQPLVTAMNAAAGVLGAYRKGDQQAANAAFETWKISSENAMKLYDYQSKVYEKVLGDLDRKEHEVDTESSHRETAAIAELRANAMSFNDPLMAEVRSVGDYERLKLARDRFALTQQLAGQKLEEKHYANQAIAELKADPNFQSLDAKGQFEKVMSVLKYRAPSEYQQVTKAGHDQFQALLGQLKSVRSQAADDLKSFKEKHGGIPPTAKADIDQQAQLQLKLQVADKSIEDAWTSYVNQLGDAIPIDESDRPAQGSGAHNVPPFPAVHEGQISTGPDGAEWIAQGGKWVLHKPAK